MSADGTVSLGLARSGSFVKVLALSGLAASLLGAHHSMGGHLQSNGLTGDSNASSPLLDGAGPMAETRRQWSSAQTFRRVSADAWGRWSALDSLQQQTVLKLNRIDDHHLRRRELVVPDSIGSELAYAPFPDSVAELRDVPKFVALSRRVQAFGAYEYGRLVKWGPTSTGKRETPTDSGLVFTNWRKRLTYSTVDPAWKLNWYFNLIAVKGVAFHEYELPGRPASHGCVRLLETDARWMFEWADQWVPGRGSEVTRYGTPVLIFGDWDYDLPAPWMGLAEGDSRARVSQGELDAALSPNLQTVLDRAGGPALLAAVEVADPQS